MITLPGKHDPDRPGQQPYDPADPDPVRPEELDPEGLPYDPDKHPEDD